MERGRVGDAFGESREHAATIRARIHLNGIRALARNGLEQLRFAELQLLTLETEPCNSEALGAVARAFCNLRKAARRRKLRDLHYYVADQERVLREALDACFVSETAIDASLDAIEVLKQYLAHTEEAVATGEALPLPKTLPALRRTIQSPVSPPHAAAPVSPDHARKRLGELLMASGDISEGDLQVALFEYEGHNGHRRLGELLLEDLRVSREQVDRAIAVQRENPDRPLLGQVLLSMGLLSTSGLNRTLDKQKHPVRRRLGEMLVRGGWVPAKRIVTALRRQSVVRDAVRYGLASLAPRFTARATETGFPRQRTRFPADQATELTLFCDKARDLLDVADRNLLVLETEPQNDVALDSVRRAIHAMSRFACYLGLADLGRFGRAFCGCLAAV
ncbi:MAG: hypothetical protein R6V12_19820, partial [Candidatus Hydrogenedentota bacterium]